MQPEDLALAARITEELLAVLAVVRNGVDDASLSAKGAQRNQEMLAEQARNVERIIDSLRRRTDELSALQQDLARDGASDAAQALERIAADFRAAFATAAGPLRRWVLANAAGEEALKIAKHKMHVAMSAVMEAAEVTRLLSDVMPHGQRASAPTTLPQ
jgi:hypothetical protein